VNPQLLLVAFGVIIVINSMAGFSAHLSDVQIDWVATGAFAGTAPCWHP
jgi:hypothetical protein